MSTTITVLAPAHTTRSTKKEYSENDLPAFKPLLKSLTKSDIRRHIPERLFYRNTRRALGYLARDILVSSVFWHLALWIDPLVGSLEAFIPSTLSYKGLILETLRWSGWATYWWFQGLAFTGLWVIGHECGHRAFSSSRRVCDAFGFVLHTLLWTPYFSWRISHARHHATHASVERDEVYVPLTRSDLNIPQPTRNEHGELTDEGIDWEEIFGDTPIYTLYMLIRQQTLAFPAYLLWNVSGQKSYPKGTNHFNPASIIFKPNERNAVLISNAGIISMILLTSWSIAHYGLMPVLKLYLIPWLLVSHWFIMITYLHHTSPSLPHYREGAWTFERGAAATVDRDFLGWQGRFFLHDVAHFHVIHHFFPSMPWYNGEEATQYLKQVIGEGYKFSDKPVFQDLWQTYNECQFVEDDGQVLFYRNKQGRAVMKPCDECHRKDK